MKDYEADYIYDVWRNGGNPDEVREEEIPDDYDWIWDSPEERHVPHLGGENDILRQ